MTEPRWIDALAADELPDNDVRDGRPLCDPVAVPLRTYPVRIERNRVFVQID